MKINLSNISVMKHSLSSTPINSRLTTVDWLNLKQTGFPPVRLIGWAHNSTFPIRSPLLPQKTLSSIYPRVPFFNHYSITQTTLPLLPFYIVTTICTVYFVFFFTSVTAMHPQRPAPKSRSHAIGNEVSFVFGDVVAGVDVVAATSSYTNA